MLAQQIATAEIKALVQEEVRPLEILVNLFRDLNQRKVRYCHWKSNIRLDLALGGRTDLDLLVDSKDEQLFRRIVSEYNIKPTLAAPGKHYPAVENYIGFDPATGTLFHLHVHYRLVLGEQFVKNYYIPLDERFLDSVQMRQGVRIPSPELELIILSIRSLLKYRDIDGAKDILSARSPGLPRKIKREVVWLLEQTSLEYVEETLKSIEGVLPADVIMEFLRIIANSSRVGFRFLALRGRVRAALRPYQRYGRFQAALIYYHQALWRQNKLIGRFMPRRKMTLFTGGKSIAFIGSDGAGKSTVIEHIVSWLSWRFTVRTYYMGSSQPSFGTGLVKSVSKTAQLSENACKRFLGKKNPLTRAAERISGLLVSLRYLAEAKDRYNRYTASQSQKAEGSIVIYDRYPLSFVRIDEDRAMDGPRIVKLNNGRSDSLLTQLEQKEEKIYQKILPPDCSLALRVSLNVALARKPDHNRTKMEAKNRAIQQVTSDDSQLVVVEVDKPLEQVLLEVKTILWDLL